MARYRKSDGTYISKFYIDKMVRKAKLNKLHAQFDIYGYNFCDDCLRSSGVFLDCSHDVSVNDCQRNGKSELAYDVNNISIRCRECHNIQDKTY